MLYMGYKWLYMGVYKMSEKILLEGGREYLSIYQNSILSAYAPKKNKPIITPWSHHWSWLKFLWQYLKRMKPRASTAALLTSSLTSLTATCNKRRIASLLPVPQYAMAMVYMAERLKMGSLSTISVSTSVRDSSWRPNMHRAMPMARPRKIFSCCVSWA